MRILFIYTKIDDTLRDRVKRLREHNAEVDTLSLLEFKLDENGKEVDFEIDSKLDFLEEKGKLRVANRVLKRKKLLSYLEDYDIIDIYKSEESSLMLVDEIENLCYCYFVTVSDNSNNINFLKKPLYSNLYKRAKFLLFDSEDKMDSFQFGKKEQYRFVPEPIMLFALIDEIKKEDILKASKTMGLELNKDIVYCDLSSSLQRQVELIEDISSMKIDRLKNSTFIFWLSNHNLEERDEIKSLLLEKNFDYLLIETMMSKRQQALIYKLCSSAIILSYSKLNLALPILLYTKSSIYLYKESKVDKIFDDEFYMKDFEEFLSKDENEDEMIKIDLLNRNSKKVYQLFDPEHSIERYIEVIKEL